MARWIDRKTKHERYLKSLEDPGERLRRVSSGAQARRYKKRPDQHLYGSRKWASMRRYILASFPVCNICKKAIATQVDHIKPHKLNPDLFFNMSNVQPVCQACHQEKSAAERRGQAFHEDGGGGKV